MALIKCPSCKNDVSDMAKTCPSCGYELKHEEQIINTCPDCNTVLSGNESKCPKCGCEDYDMLNGYEFEISEILAK